MKTCEERQEELCQSCKALGILFWGLCPIHQSRCRPQDQMIPDDDAPESVTPEITGESRLEFGTEQTAYEEGFGFIDVKGEGSGSKMD